MQTNRFVMGLALAAILSGCGNDGAEQAATPEAAEPPPAATLEPAPAPADVAPPAAAPVVDEAAPAAEPPAVAPADEAELTYEPIDTSKLENTWYEQYSAGQ